MGVINVLDKNVAELIAAGEVVERPASIVKELVENALDAGADKITVEIRGGGIKYIRVSDNGCGISREDIPKAFLRNATSKIKTPQDLEKILTFGFRGEALASVAAMCEVELVTRTKDEEVGSKYIIKGSEKGEIYDIGCSVGTTLIIRNVFFNTPARLKFLKKDSYEGSNVISVLEKLAMVNSNVSFKAVKDGMVVMNTPGNSDLKSSVHSIMGSEFADNLIETNYCQNNLSVYGFITKPASSKATRAAENFYINSRFVKSKTCQAAVEDAYKGSMMVGKFPGCVLNLQIPADTVDVNVHPAKTEVRFSDERLIYDLVFAACRMALRKDNENNPIRTAKPQPKYVINEFSLKDFDYSDRQVKVLDLPIQEEVKTKLETVKLNVFENRPQKYDYNIPQPVKKEEKPQIKSEVIQKLLDNVKKNDFSNSEISDKKEAEPKIQMPEIIEYRIIGELFKTYILIEKGNSLFMIDKHAAHERYIYNALSKNEIIAGQYLFTPIEVTASVSYCTIAKEKSDIFDKMGYKADIINEHTLVLTMIPAVLDSQSAKDCFLEICEKISLSNDVTPELIDDLYHSMACRSAVKANDLTGQSDMEKLVDIVINDIDVSYCPHGRPVIVEVTKNKIERMFGRIV